MTAGSFSGNGDFTGTGTVNPTKLFIPQKDSMDGPTRTMAQTLETFINSLNAPSGAVSADRLAVTANSTNLAQVNWTGATIHEQIGTTCIISGTNLETTTAGVYAINYEAVAPWTSGTTAAPFITWTDTTWTFQNQLPPTSAIGSTSISLVLTFVYHFPANTIHKFTCGNVSAGSIFNNVWIQRIG